MASGVWTPTTYYYSLAFELNRGQNIEHVAYDSATQRVTAQIYTNLRNPQLAVVADGQDSNVYRISMSSLTGEPRWMIHQSAGLFKQAVDHSELVRLVREPDGMLTTSESRVQDIITKKLGVSLKQPNGMARNGSTVHEERFTDPEVGFLHSA